MAIHEVESSPANASVDTRLGRKVPLWRILAIGAALPLVLIAVAWSSARLLTFADREIFAAGENPPAEVVTRLESLQRSQNFLNAGVIGAMLGGLGSAVGALCWTSWTAVRSGRFARLVIAVVGTTLGMASLAVLATWIGLQRPPGANDLIADAFLHGVLWGELALGIGFATADPNWSLRTASAYAIQVGLLGSIGGVLYPLLVPLSDRVVYAGSLLSFNDPARIGWASIGGFAVVAAIAYARGVRFADVSSDSRTPDEEFDRSRASIRDGHAAVERVQG